MAVALRSHGFLFGVRVVPIGHESLQASDAYRLEFDAHGALGFALGLLRADTSADCRQCRCRVDYLISSLPVAFLCLHDEVRDADVDRAAFHARFVLAVEAPLGLGESYLLRVSQRYLVKIVRADLRVLCRHFMFLRIKCHFSSPFPTLWRPRRPVYTDCRSSRACASRNRNTCGLLRSPHQSRLRIR